MDIQKEDKYSGFRERLETLMLTKEFSTKVEFSAWLGISRQSLSMIMNGQRPPTQKLLDILFLKTNKPEEYWLFGVDNDKEYSDARKEFKMLNKAFNDVLELELMTLDGEYTSAANEKLAQSLFDMALKSDLAHILLKKRQRK